MATFVSFAISMTFKVKLYAEHLNLKHHDPSDHLASNGLKKSRDTVLRPLMSTQYNAGTSNTLVGFPINWPVVRNARGLQQTPMNRLGKDCWKWPFPCSGHALHQLWSGRWMIERRHRAGCLILSESNFEIKLLNNKFARSIKILTTSERSCHPFQIWKQCHGPQFPIQAEVLTCFHPEDGASPLTAVLMVRVPRNAKAARCLFPLSHTSTV